MSTTNLDVITAALRLINVIAEGDTPSPEQAATGLDAMNEFLEDWSSQGIDVGQWPQTDLTLEFPCPPEIHQTVKAWLASTLAPYYERDARPSVISMASAGYARLLREAVLDRMGPVDLDLLPLPSHLTGLVDA